MNGGEIQYSFQDDSSQDIERKLLRIAPLNPCYPSAGKTSDCQTGRQVTALPGLLVSRTVKDAMYFCGSRH